MQDYYQQVAEEIERKELSKGIWARAMSESEGDPSKAESLDIKYRVKELKSGGISGSVKSGHQDYLQVYCR